MFRQYICPFFVDYEMFSKHGYSWQSQMPTLSSSECSKFSRASDGFLKLLMNVMDAFDHFPNALDILKKAISQLVLPLGGGKVVPIIHLSYYEKAATTRELFRVLSPFWNPLSPGLLQYLVEQSHCHKAVTAVATFNLLREQHSDSVLCVHDINMNEPVTECHSAPLSSGHYLAHSIPLDQLQSVHPSVFRRLDNHKVVPPCETFRISVEVNRRLLTQRDYDDVTDAVGAFFQLPKIALVYAGCSVSPVVLCWLVPSPLLEYIKAQSSSAVCGDRMMAEHGVVSVAVGDDLRIKCLTMKVNTISAFPAQVFIPCSLQEVELGEAAFYGLDEIIPQLVQQGVDINATEMVSETQVTCKSLMDL